jgi:hypothetical protein
MQPKDEDININSLIKILIAFIIIFDHCADVQYNRCIATSRVLARAYLVKGVHVHTHAVSNHSNYWHFPVGAATHEYGSLLSHRGRLYRLPSHEVEFTTFSHFEYSINSDYVLS